MAFDVIPHSIIYKKLKVCNFTEDKIKFLKIYKENRKQIVQDEVKLSDPDEDGDRTSLP